MLGGVVAQAQWLGRTKPFKAAHVYLRGQDKPVTFMVFTAAGHDLYLRVEVGLLAGSAIACLGMAALVAQLVRSGASVHTGDLIEAIHDLSVEP